MRRRTRSSKKYNPLPQHLKQEEIEAIYTEFAENSGIDRYFLLKLQLALVIAFIYAGLLILYPTEISAWLVPSGTINGRPVESILFARGIFIALGAMTVAYSYKTRMHMPLVFGSSAVIVTSNLFTDQFIFYAEGYASLSLRLATVLLIRVLEVLLIISLYRNLDRIPADRRLFRLPFRAIG